MPPELSLAVNGLGISFTDNLGARIEIADNMTFGIAPGESLCLVGRSGSGKTSILRAVAGLSQPQAGVISWWGTELAELSEKQRRSTRRDRIGYVDQAASLVPDLSAIENVLLPVLPDGAAAVRAREVRAADLLRAFGLEGRTGNRPVTLSGGERQRVAIARALINDPDLLIVDEPTASLDAAWADEIIRMLVEQQRSGCALLLASHDEAVIAASGQVIRVEHARDVAARAGNHQL
jgi:ABC-type lipoprotein export system ATPase subunit